MRDDSQNKAVKAIGPAMKKVQQSGITFKHKTSGGHIG